jgi:hypothetical protein
MTAKERLKRPDSIAGMAYESISLLARPVFSQMALNSDPAFHCGKVLWARRWPHIWNNRRPCSMPRWSAVGLYSSGLMIRVG